MVDKKKSSPIEEESTMHYGIKVRGHLDEHWSEWLGDFEITHDRCGNTLLSGSIKDQAALYGILAQVRDLGLTLISLTPQGDCVEAKECTGEDINGNPA